MNYIETINSYVNGFIWGVPAMICIIGVGIYLSVRTGFLQIRKFGFAFRHTAGKIFDKTEGCYRGNRRLNVHEHEKGSVQRNILQ